jgi:hypothetical protein
MVIVVGSRQRALNAWTTMAVGLACLACGPADEIEIEGRRIVSAASRPVETGWSTAQRFGARVPQSTQPPLSWTLPAGWDELQTSGMRLANLRPAGNPDAECSLIILGQDGGGLAANVNRWRQEQMGLGPLAPDEVQDLPLINLLGAGATRVALTGTYTNMGSPPRAGWGLTGAILVSDRFTIFVKMTGPAPLVAAEGDAFDAFCSSLRVRLPGQARGGNPPDATRTASVQQTAPDPPPEDAYPNDAGSAFGFSLPSGWREQPPRGMRVVNLEAGTGAQCYVVEMAGEAGGLTDNINRWCGQVGAPAMGDAAAAALPRIQCLGQACPLIELTGAQQDSALLGVLLIRPEGSLFVKMIGPRDELLAEREAFVAFVQSLERVR